ncbi:V/A-type H+-transporting ATPase subunit F [Clostridium tetanomorphum]|uniref:ATP synthase subunit F n=1 Tax=Clostridium tetanomorphum TaxID=1553 RepID=A0A923J0G3_CLOTT|nr:V-type ATP synthase subunit F [Clostridium tetanomorphum]KAJ49322.1 V-type ATP synthase subunit F [Clostridium tetanomorphum DSM 665]KAJ50485.1 V-type ATP synthase subunit F [Clostridium tetanomorphum DSM 665]MBC2398276.1 ATP synthase subunit F [Clostridium tetanomorphum]MBP1865607.1 V/A-type H+-transporting ATPase subunit F [Clostridium tetanomorphum]NRS85887.1 V/A-type H+-transporting ATPase subunit F [Clostridium tetanomorphum]
MKTYLISDNIDTLVGLKIAGIQGKVVHTREEVLIILDQLLKDKNIGIIVLTERIALLIEDRVKEIKLSKYLPLIIEIPDRHGSIKEGDWILGYIKDAIGLKI